MKNYGVILAISGAICWGISGVCAQFLFRNYQIDPYFLTIIRMFSGGVFLLIVSLFKNGSKIFKLFKNKDSIINLILFTILGLIPSQLFYLIAIDYSNAATATVLQYTAPIIIMIYTCLKNLTLPSKNDLFALFLVIVGVFILTTHTNIETLVISKEALIFGLLSAFGFFFYSILPIKLLREYGSITIVSFGFLLGSIIIYLIKRPDLYLKLDLYGYLALTILIVVGTAIAYSFYLFANLMIGSKRASIFASLEPVTAALLSVIVLNTIFNSYDIIGFVMIILAVAII